MAYLWWIGMCFVFSFLSLSHSQLAQADIFGRDDRSQALENKLIKPYADAVAVAVLRTVWEDANEEGYKSLDLSSLSGMLCENERFSDQYYVDYACTGFLVGPDLLVTAGHCATHTETQIQGVEDLYCDSYTWMFDFYLGTPLDRIPNDSVYTCKKIIYAVYDGDVGQRDFALIQLDRPVVGRKPLKISKKAPRKGESVFMLGHPMGMPMKYTGRASVTNPLDEKEPNLLTDLDALAGNSGSPVFNSKNEVIGVLVGGVPNSTTYYDSKLQCYRYNHCDQDGKNCKEIHQGLSVPEAYPESFSEVQKISHYYDLIHK